LAFNNSVQRNIVAGILQHDIKFVLAIQYTRM